MDNSVENMLVDIEVKGGERYVYVLSSVLHPTRLPHCTLHIDSAVHVIFYLLKKLKVCLWWKVNLAYLANLWAFHSNNNYWKQII